eukprot:15441085-Alexandrium_andersonii.AAC.1
MPGRADGPAAAGMLPGLPVRGGSPAGPQPTAPPPPGLADGPPASGLRPGPGSKIPRQRPEPEISWNS